MLRLVLLLLSLFTVSCIVIPASYSDPPDMGYNRIEGGALVQGSRAWKSRELCGDNCVRVVDGPITVNYLKVSSQCGENIHVGVEDSYTSRYWQWALVPGQKVESAQFYLATNQRLIISASGEYNGDCYFVWGGYRSW